MALRKNCKSATQAAIGETAEGLHFGGLMDTHAMRQFDHACLASVHPSSAASIHLQRERTVA